MQLAPRTLHYLCGLLLVVGSIRSADANCLVSAQSVSFGAYNSLTSIATESTGLVEVSCSVQTSYQIALSSGNGVYTERQMTNNSNTLIYNLYTDPSYSYIWGDGSGLTSTVSGATATTQLHDIFGRIPAYQDVATGSYSDVIIVTVEF